MSSALSAKDVHESQCFLWAGDSCCGGTPGPIPNPEVKPTRADGTAGATLWESRASPSHKPYWLFFCLSARFGALSCWYRSIVGIRPACSSTSSEKRRASSSWGRPPSFASTVGRDLSPTRRLCARLYAQMVSAASLPEVRAQPLLAPEGLLEPMTAPTTSPQANRPWMDSPALFWTSSEPLTTRPPMVVA